MTKSSLEAIAEGIRANKSLKVLDLSYCAIADSCGGCVIRLIQE